MLLQQVFVSLPEINSFYTIKFLSTTVIPICEIECAWPASLSEHIGIWFLFVGKGKANTVGIVFVSGSNYIPNENKLVNYVYIGVD